ncbi:spore germination protein [Paenibacillus alginolyticus]|uniref:spore germination protein n=1 Tax=Paenibacillus alginolyticus TaxID=59839 RepID=UPI0003FC516E|nr:spore germination protein [Paenibacillus alginolyticus]MCY9665775.1 spore germination protein [Paenibacillus alginolyticus]
MGIIKTIKAIFNKSQEKQTDKISGNQWNKPLFSDLKANIHKVQQAVGNSTDVIIREMKVGESGDVIAAVIYTDGLTDTKSVNNFVIENLLQDLRLTEVKQKVKTENILQIMRDFALTVGEIKEVSDFETFLTSVLSGDTAILIDGYSSSFLLSLREWDERGVTEPSAQTVIRGPREAFSENIRTNTALIRRKIKDHNLWLESKQIGRVTKTNVAIMYIHGIANEKVLEEVRSRLNRIDIDGILESGYIEELIQDKTYTTFPTVFNSERPDTIAGGLLEGRVAILVDGTPFVLLVPAIFTQYFQSAEDYYQRADIGSLLRILRYISFFVALLGPSLYVAVTTFHQEMLPTQLLISLASQREGVPFPTLIEAMLMEITFEILREAGIRMPRAVGQSVSIVGALVIGQAAVEAGIVTAAMVIVVSITAIASFVSPNFNMAIAVRILRFPIMLLAATFGLYGITVGLVALVFHLCSLRSFGVPYLTPFAPFIAVDQKDAIFRVPLWGMFSRPRLISQKNIYRENTSPDMNTNPRNSEKDGAAE